MSFNKSMKDTFYWNRIVDAKLVGPYDMPTLQAIHNVTPHNLVPFHMTLSSPNATNCWFHFYEDDYQFERFWKNPDRYFPTLDKFKGGIGTDFSVYLDMPKSQQIWNCFRNRSATYLMQKRGYTVIPNVSWSDNDSLNWAFDGIPEHSILSITTQGCMGRDYVCKQSLLNGLHELAIQKHPESVFVYGKFPSTWVDRFPMPIIVHPSFAEERWGKQNG